MSDELTDFLSALQQECADKLLADPFFEYVPVLTEQIDDIANENQRALSAGLVQGGKTGTCVVIMTPEADTNFENVAGPFFDDVKVLVQVDENVTVNRDPDGTGTGIHAAKLAVAVCRSFHQFFPLCSTGPLVAVKPTLRLNKFSEYLSYHVTFRTMGGTAEFPPQLPQPVIVNNAGVYTITCPTPGAAVFYTVDGKNASPRVSTAVLALAPVPLPAGLTLSARAWLAGYQASKTTTIITA